VGRESRLRSWLLLLLIVHILVHPVAHTFGTNSSPAHRTTVTLPGNSSTVISSLEDCNLCRAGHGAMLWADLRQTEWLNPVWIPVRLPAVSYASFRTDHQLPSRAPPSL
jgi:hypothetical protein